MMTKRMKRKIIYFRFPVSAMMCEENEDEEEEEEEGCVWSNLYAECKHGILFPFGQLFR